MKIGIFTDSYLPYTSGVVRSIQTFTEELTNHGHEVFIFAPSYRNCRKESRIFRFSSIPSPTNHDFTLAMPFSIRLRPTIKKLNLDLIHVHSPFLLGRLGARYARMLGIPLVFTYHTLYEQYVHYVPFAQSFTKELAQKISRAFCNYCDAVFVPTGVIRDYLQGIGVKKPIRIVPTGIKVAEYQNGDRGWLQRHFNLPPGEKILLFVGRLGQEKNINFLMECFIIVSREISNTRLVLVGGGPEEEELKNRAKELGISEQVTFTGVLPPSDVVNCYAGSDIFVFSSVTETQGIVITEAKAAGLPVVAVAAYGVSEMIQDGIDGYLTELEPLQFAEKVCFLLKDVNIRKEMSLRGQQNAEMLSVAKCTATLVDCYRQVIERNTLVN
ncbi:MAG: Alpha-monoglucosyldiacylglycerol synthase [Pelotomaculum sp. PtaU1.Bin035]|nr:MAG: Alpha-monoglucosyldiacylglycerol synthase [Pelotomaculum sp. PtaU1.Bin035]